MFCQTPLSPLPLSLYYLQLLVNLTLPLTSSQHNGTRCRSKGCYMISSIINIDSRYEVLKPLQHNKVAHLWLSPLPSLYTSVLKTPTYPYIRALWQYPLLPIHSIPGTRSIPYKANATQSITPKLCILPYQPTSVRIVIQILHPSLSASSSYHLLLTGISILIILLPPLLTEHPAKSSSSRRTLPIRRRWTPSSKAVETSTSSSSSALYTRLSEQ